MGEIDEKYLDVLYSLGWGMFKTEIGVNLYRNTSTGTFLVKLAKGDFVDVLADYALTFDPNTYVSLKIKNDSSERDISAMLKNAKDIQMHLLRLAIKLIKISKEVEYGDANEVNK